MAQVTIQLNGYNYSVNCKDGEENHLRAMAAQIEKRIDRVRGLGTQGGESRTLMLAALLMADEIFDLSQAKLPAAANEAITRAEHLIRDGKMRDQRLKILAERAESIAETLEHP